jgi:hypothetical protein
MLNGAACRLSLATAGMSITAFRFVTKCTPIEQSVACQLSVRLFRPSKTLQIRQAMIAQTSVSTPPVAAFERNLCCLTRGNDRLTVMFTLGKQGLEVHYCANDPFEDYQFGRGFRTVNLLRCKTV